MLDYASPRRHAWVTPRSSSQIAAPGIFFYFSVTFLSTTLPSLRRYLLDSRGPLKHLIQVLLGCCIPLVPTALATYFLVAFKLPVVPQEEVAETEAPGPLCIHCHAVLAKLPKSTGSTAGEAREGAVAAEEDNEHAPAWHCKACGASAGEVNPVIDGRWAYGRYGASIFDIERDHSGSLRYIEGLAVADLRCLSFLDPDAAADETEEGQHEAEPVLTYLANVDEKTRLRFRLVKDNLLQVQRQDEEVMLRGTSWVNAALARRVHGGGTAAAAHGEWVLPVCPGGVTESPEDEEEPGLNETQGTSLEDLGGRQAWGGFALRPSPKGPDYVNFCEVALGPEEVAGDEDVDRARPEMMAGGVLRRSGLSFSGELEGMKPSQYEAPETLGSAHIRVAAGHLVFHFKPRGSLSWGEGKVAVRRDVSAWCISCGLASCRPTDVNPHVAKHCHICLRCIPGFDHHCKYLNQCIGDHNYKWWFTLVASVQGLCTAMSVSSAFVLSQVCRSARDGCSESMNNPVWPVRFVINRWGCSARDAYRLLLGPASVLGGAAALWMAALMCYHVYLGSQKRTTLEALLEVNGIDIYRRRVLHQLMRLQELSLQKERRFGSLWICHGGRSTSSTTCRKVPSRYATFSSDMLELELGQDDDVPCAGSPVHRMSGVPLSPVSGIMGPGSPDRMARHASFLGATLNPEDYYELSASPTRRGSAGFVSFGLPGEPLPSPSGKCVLRSASTLESTPKTPRTSKLPPKSETPTLLRGMTSPV